MHAVEIKQEHSKLILEISKELENLENDTYGSEVEEIGIIPIIVTINKYPKTRKLTFLGENVQFFLF
ncbi:Imm44 family immunity protein [Bacillus wiedmannii]|uniref:Imm44 family immunity protein n=1 Tax=Bacillus wiedmannii TaxID=1890302 RepID=UPI0030C9E6AB